MAACPPGKRPAPCPGTGLGEGKGARPGDRTHPEVLRIHVQFVAVQLAQLGVGGLDVVQVLHGLPEGGQHFLAMGTHLGVADDGGGAGEVPEGREKPLGPGVDDQQPREETRGFSATFLHIDLAPQAGDELLLFGRPVHHGGELGVACRGR
uniref:Uncharacterized protein n=1 Tax=Pelusios castaneus TaxID=367368 RepID=A0A8C8RF82_9SAUR